MAPLNEPSGYWGSPTATLDWCESNYEVSYYIAEFWNTITNLMMIIPSLKGLYTVKQQNFESRFSILYLCLLLTGIGSWMFHMTLLYEMQLLDELPMVWGSSYMVYSLYKVRVMPEESSRGMAAGMGAYAVVTTIVYLANKDPIFFETMYGILVFALMGMDMHLNYIQRSKTGLNIFLGGLISYGVGFALWNIDNGFCNQLQRLRMSTGPKLAPITQLHGWWHLLAGYATHLHIQSCIHHRQRFLKDDVTFKCSWIGLEAQRQDKQPKKQA